MQLLLSLLMNNRILLITLLGVLGCVMGSFINVLVYRFTTKSPSRLKPQQKLAGLLFSRSACPQCKMPLAAWQLIPIMSWLLLKRRCYGCNGRISVHYPLVELLAGLLFITMGIYYPPSWAMVILLALTSSGLLLALIDIHYYLLPDRLTQPMLWFGLLVSYMSDYYPTSSLNLLPVHNLDQAFVGCLFGFILLWLPAICFQLYRGYAGLGGGDIKLFAALGAWLPYAQLPLLLVIASGSGIGYLLLRRYISGKAIKRIPFGPFILFGGWLVLIYNGTSFH